MHGKEPLHTDNTTVRQVESSGEDNAVTDHSRNALAPVVVIQINGKQFVTGLFWQPLTQPRTYLKEAREIGKRERMKWLVLQRGSILQAGFVGTTEKEDSVQQGMFSLAAVLARKLGPSWVGVFPLEDGRYALIAVNDGTIIPGCDMIAERQTVQAKLDAIYRHFSWERTYLPADFNYSDGSLDLTTLLASNDLKREDRLKRLAFGLSVKEVSIAMIALTLAVIFVYFQGHAKQRQRIQEDHRQSEYLRHQANINAQAEPPPIKAPSYPWVTLPLVDDFLPPCIQAMQAMPLFIGGWKFDTAKCVGQIVAATYLRKGNATANDFLTEARSHFEVEPAFYQQGESAVVQTKVSWQARDTESLQSLQPLAAVLASFSSHFQALGIQPTLTEKTQIADQSLLLPGQQNTEPALKPDWRTFGFSLSTRLVPDIVFSGLFSNLSTASIRLTELSINLQDTAQLNWQIVGEIYAK